MPPALARAARCFPPSSGAPRGRPQRDPPGDTCVHQRGLAALWETGAHLGRFPPPPALPPAVPEAVSGVPEQISSLSPIRGHRPPSRTPFLPSSNSVPDAALGAPGKLAHRGERVAGVMGWAQTHRGRSPPPAPTPNKEPVPSCSAVDGRVASSYRSETEEVLLASGRPGRRAAADHWHPPRELQPFTWVPASAGLRGAAQGAVPRAGGAGRTAAAALPCSSGPAGRLFIRGPGPGPCRSIGQSAPLRAAPRAAALCPRRAPRRRRRRRRPRGGREPAPPVGSTFSSSSSSSGSYSLCFSPPALVFAGHPGQFEPVVTERVGKEEAEEMEVERRAVGALLSLSRLPAGPGRPGGGRASRGPLPGPGSGPEAPRPRESWAPAATGPLGAHASAPPGAAAPRRPPRPRAGPPRRVCAVGGSPSLKMSASLPGSPRFLDGRAPSWPELYPQLAAIPERQAPELCGVGAPGQ